MIHCKNYFNLTKTFLLRLLKKMAVDQTESSMHELRSVIKFLIGEKFKPCEIYIRMSDLYRKACFNPKNIYKWAKHGFAMTRLSQKDTVDLNH